METSDDIKLGFDLEHTVHELGHYLPSQAPLKDFIHHNTLHAFQHDDFFTGIRKASAILGFNTTLSLDEYRHKFHSGEINSESVYRILRKEKSGQNIDEWYNKMVSQLFFEKRKPRIGSLRNYWRNVMAFDIDMLVQPILFRVLCSYLDQGISIWRFPITSGGFLENLRAMEKNSFNSIFQNKQSKAMLLDETVTIEQLLKRIVGDEFLYERYLFDQQFSHPGWSGMVATVEQLPESLLDTRRISLKELIHFELILEYDRLVEKFGEGFNPLSIAANVEPMELFGEVEVDESDEVIRLWQLAYEWNYYDQVLDGLKAGVTQEKAQKDSDSFQALFCIDDRECSIRRHLESEDPNCKTYGTPGFFGVEFYYQPESGKFYTKHCPAPVTPQFLIKEVGAGVKHQTDMHFNQRSNSLLFGWLISQSIGFWSAIKLFYNIFRPGMSPATASSLKHMDQISELTVEYKGQTENGLQIGYKVEQMADRLETLLKSIGLTSNFAPIVYLIGHGSSSVNNPHYAAYDCGACSGRPGSVNARVMSTIGNHPEVRKILAERGIFIPEETQFVGGLQDTTRDEIVFYDEEHLSLINKKRHEKNKVAFESASDMNALERSRRFELVNTNQIAKRVHEKVKLRSVSLFEPRPELNHATNTLCIVGRRELTKYVFLDRRAFLNSFDYQIDPEGNYLFGILKAAAPVCGGINLEYYFSRVDNAALGAGSKLPHNVMGLFGVANGIDGDLRPGLPSQMIEVHDPLRLMIVVEHFPEIILKTIQRDANTYEWFKNEWVHLVAVHPESREFYLFSNESFSKYEPQEFPIKKVKSVVDELKKTQENLPVFNLN